MSSFTFKIETFFPQRTDRTQQATMTIRHLYPNAKEPTAPRFQVGDVVYTKGVINMPGYSFALENAAYADQFISQRGFADDQVTVHPAVFGVIVDEPDHGAVVHDSTTMPCKTAHGPPSGPLIWYGVDDPMTESELDIPGSGSVWFLPDNERRYFVKWINKAPYPRSHPPPRFQPARLFNLALMPENYLCKAPNFLHILRGKVRKRFEVQTLLEHHLQIDQCSARGISSIVCMF